MEAALYGPGGYYAENTPIGRAGDYITGSAASPLFGQTTGRLVAALDAVLGRPADYLEVGYGGGEHLAALVEALGDDRPRRLLGHDRVARPAPAGVALLGTLDELQAGSIEGLIFSYELFDALPFHRLVGRASGLGELYVVLGDEGCFAWEEGKLSDSRLAELVPVELQEGQIADVSTGGASLYGQLASKLGRGLIVTFEYGYEAAKLFDPRVRFHGTLACHRKHRVHRNPFVDIADQDLTAHVDLSALVRAGEACGLKTLALTRQAAWLAAAGLLDGMAERSVEERTAALELMNLEGMGGEIRVLVQGRDVDLADLLPGWEMLNAARSQTQALR